MTGKQRAELLEVVAELRAADAAIDAFEIVDQIVAREKLWHALREDLARDRLIVVVNSALERAIEGDAQMALPGFELVPAIIRIGSAPPVATAKATLPQLTAYRDWYKKSLSREDARRESIEAHLKELNKLVKLMSRAAKDAPEITVEEALAEKAAKGK